MLIGTPAMWWLAIPMLGWAMWRSVFRARTGATGGAGRATSPGTLLVPNIDRQMYFFYVTPLAAFLVLGLDVVPGRDPGQRHGAGSNDAEPACSSSSLYVGLVVANFAWLWPILNGVAITAGQWDAERWLPSWR